MGTRILVEGNTMCEGDDLFLTHQAIAIGSVNDDFHQSMLPELHPNSDSMSHVAVLD